MRILVACETTQTVAEQFYLLGHEVWSCDLLPGEKGLPHIQDNVLKYLGECQENNFKGWDMMLAFPPCTHLAVSGAKHFAEKIKDGRQKEGIDFFMAFTKTNIPKVCIENPVGIMSSIYRKPDQIVNPWQFGDTYQKTTCLWLTGLPKLFHAKEKDMFNDKITHVSKGEFIVTSGGNKLPKWYSDAKVSSRELTQKVRNKTFPGIAAAMADQWG